MSFLQRIISVSVSRGNDIALVDSSCSLSYSQLRLMTNILAHYLEGISGPETGFVALLLPRTVFFPVAAVGVLKGGHAFVPMAVDNTPEYNQAVLSDSMPFAIITTSDVWDRLTYLHSLKNVNVILMDELLERDGLEDGDIDLSAEEKPAMLIYTSGTTGHPKAVLHSLRSLSKASEYCSSLDADGSGHKSRATVLDFCFLAGVVDFLASLMVGGTCHIVPDSVARNIELLAIYLKEKGIFSITTIGDVAKMLLQKDTGVRCYKVTGGQMPVIGNPVPCGIAVRNTYGMTECGACLSYMVNGKESPVPIGKPVKGVRVYLLDDDSNPVPDGQIGEIFISSDGLSMGYFHDEVRTSEHFVDCPFEKGRRMFRTGDFARVLPSGDMLYCGRRDDMVKVRGVRIHTAQVENAAMSCDGVSKAVTVLSGNGILCLFYSGMADSQALAVWLECRLPACMMPGRIIKVDNIPVNNHGKVDRDGLKKQLAGSTDSTLVMTAVQERVLSAMRRVLGFDDIGLNDDFFHFGGNSLNVVELLSELDDFDLRVEDIYRERTACRIASVAHLKTCTADSSHGGPICLTPFQKRVLESQLTDTESVMWNNPVLFRLGNDCDVDRLFASLQTVARHHPALSCVPDLPSGGLRHVSFGEFPIDFAHFDGNESVESVMSRLTVPYPMSGAPLWRIRLFSLSDGNYMFLDFHHLIFDGTSFCIFINNLFRAYRGEDLPADNFFSCVRESERLREMVRPVSLEGWSYSPFKPDGRTGGMRYYADEFNTALSRRDIDSAQKEFGFGLDVYAIAAAGMALKECIGKSNLAINWMYANRTNCDRRNSFGAYIRMFTVYLELEGKSCLEVLNSVHEQLELCFAGKCDEYICKDVLSGSDPVLINNQTGFDLNLEKSPFWIKRVDYPYCIMELIEYLDIELYYSGDNLRLDVSCGSRSLIEGDVTSFSNVFVSCLENLVMGKYE